MNIVNLKIYLENFSEDDYTKLSKFFDQSKPLYFTIKYRVWLNDRIISERFYPELLPSDNKILCENVSLIKNICKGSNKLRVETFMILNFNQDAPGQAINNFFYNAPHYLLCPNIVIKKLLITEIEDNETRDNKVVYPDNNTFAFEI